MSRGTDSRSTGSFVRGMTIGALLGAVVAGSSLWSRRRLARRTAANEAAILAQPGPDAPETPTSPERPEVPGTDSL